MCVQSPELVTEIRLKRKYLCLVREENIWSICQFKTCQALEEHHSVIRSDTNTDTNIRWWYRWIFFALHWNFAGKWREPAFDILLPAKICQELWNILKFSEFLSCDPWSDNVEGSTSATTMPSLNSIVSNKNSCQFTLSGLVKISIDANHWPGPTSHMLQ